MGVNIATSRRQAQQDEELLENIEIQAQRAKDAKTVTTDDGRTIGIIDAKDVRTERQRWLYYPFIPLGDLTVISGRSGETKSTLSLHFAAMATKGELEGDYKGTPVNVLTSNQEDSNGAQKARLTFAGGDADRLKFMRTEKDFNGRPIKTDIMLPRDLPYISELLKTMNIKLWIIDPITSKMEGSAKDMNDVRAVVDPLAAIAEELDMAIVLITHNRKGDGVANDMVNGSTAWLDACRSALIVAKDKENGDYVTTLTKSSHTGDADTSYSYGVHEGTITDDNGEEMKVTRVTGIMPTKRSVQDIIDRTYQRDNIFKRAENGEVQQYLEDLLAKGPMSFAKILEAAKKAETGYNAQQLRNAKNRSGGRIESVPDTTKTGSGQPRVWQPNKELCSPSQ